MKHLCGWWLAERTRRDRFGECGDVLLQAVRISLFNWRTRVIDFYRRVHFHPAAPAAAALPLVRGAPTAIDREDGSAVAASRTATGL
jgi:hypothetical protein